MRRSNHTKPQRIRNDGMPHPVPMKMGIRVLVALCEETEGLSFPTRSGKDIGCTIFSNSSLERFDPVLSHEKTKMSLHSSSFLYYHPF